MKVFAKFADDLLFLAGAAALVRGAWLLAPAAGWLTAGVLLMAAAFLVTRVKP